jgi:hypothetical protein
MRPIAVLQFSQIDEIICRWETNFHDRGRSESGTGPNKAVALATARIGVDRREFDARACQDAGSMFFDPAAARGEAAR